MRVDRNIARKITRGSGDPEKPVPLSKEEALSFEDFAVPVISKKKLIINKLATGREKDRLDAEKLKSVL